MDNTKRFTKEELIIAEKNNYQFVADISKSLDMLKGFEVGYSNPKKGKMIINRNGINFVVDVEPIGEGTLNEAMKNYNWIFNS